jgi:hypothetical protein
LRGEHEAISIGSGLYLIFAQLVAFQIGAYIATRGARFPDHFGGLLTGFLVWASAVVVAILIATFTAGATASGDAIPSGVAETVGELSDAIDGQGAAASELATAEDTAAALATIAWWTAGALSLGLARSLADGSVRITRNGRAVRVSMMACPINPRRAFKERTTWAKAAYSGRSAFRCPSSSCSSYLEC